MASTSLKDFGIIAGISFMIVMIFWFIFAYMLGFYRKNGEWQWHWGVALVCMPLGLYIYWLGGI